MQGNATTDTGTGAVVFRNRAITSGENRLGMIVVNRDGANDSGFMTFHTENAGTTSEKMRITKDGSVGIGTTTPGNKLDVISDTTFGGIDTTRFSTAVGGGFLRIRHARGTFGAPTAVVQADESGKIIFGGYDGAAYKDMAAIVAEVDGVVSANTVPTALSFDTGSTSRVERMRITSAGNVGIGTTSPGHKLDVYDTAFRQLALRGGNGQSQALYLGSVADTVGTFIGSNSYYNTSFQYTPTYTAASGIEFRQTGDMEFYTDTGLTSGVLYNPTERMVITNAGSVGIGTTNPLATLHVAGTINATNINATNQIWLGTYSDSQINFRDFDFIVRDEARARSVIRRTWASSEGDFLELRNVQGGAANLDDNITISQSLGIIFSTDGTEKMRIEPGGDVGIGTTGPINKLDVEGGAVIGATYSGTNTAPANGLLVEGNVGIGRTTAAYDLDVLGVIRASSGSVRSNIFYDEDNTAYFLDPATSTTSLNVAGGAALNGTKGSTELVRMTGGRSTGSYSTLVVLGGLTTCSWPSGGNAILGCGETNDFYAGGAGTNYGAASSVRWKKNITEIKNALEMVNGIRAVSFDWDEEHGGRHDIGFISEEVRNYIPEIIIPDPEDENYTIGMDYTKMTPVLLQAIKEQQEQIEQLKKENEQIRARLLVLEEKMNRTDIAKQQSL